MYHDHCLCLPGWHHYTNFNCTFVDWFINWHISFPGGRTTPNLKNKRNKSQIVYIWNYVGSIWLMNNVTVNQWFSILLSKWPNYSKNFFSLRNRQNWVAKCDWYIDDKHQISGHICSKSTAITSIFKYPFVVKALDRLHGR